MKKILFITHAIGYGGAGKMITYVANYMCNHGYKVAMYIQEQNGTFYSLDDKIEVIQETKFYTNYYTRHLPLILRLRMRIKEVKPNIIISFSTNQNFFSILATAFTKIPVLVSERGDPYQYNNIVAKIKNIIINKAEGVVFQTNEARDYFKGLKNKSRVIPNPVTLSKVERPIYETRKEEIAFVGRFDIKQKRQDIMIKAFFKVAKEHDKISLVFYGGGKDIDIIRKEVKEVGVERRVVFKGVVDNVISHIKDSKMFVLTSDFEGMPNALIEAMAAGLPCISTDCTPGGARYLINSGQNGIIVARGKDEEVANAISYLLNNPTIADEMGKNAQEIISKLDYEKIMLEWKRYIDTFL